MKFSYQFSSELTSYLVDVVVHETPRVSGRRRDNTIVAVTDTLRSDQSGYSTLCKCSGNVSRKYDTLLKPCIRIKGIARRGWNTVQLILLFGAMPKRGHRPLMRNKDVALYNIHTDLETGPYIDEHKR